MVLSAPQPPQLKKNGTRKIPTKQTRRKQSRNNSPMQLIPGQKKGEFKNYVSVWILSNPEGIPGDNSTGHEVPKNQVLLGRCSSFFLPILLSFCIRCFREARGERKKWRNNEEMQPKGRFTNPWWKAFGGGI
jgi:hypothetical protein